jgi:hypothetical protein
VNAISLRQITSGLAGKHGFIIMEAIIDPQDHLLYFIVLNTRENAPADLRKIQKPQGLPHSDTALACRAQEPRERHTSSVLFGV